MASREKAVETQYANVIGNLNLLFSIRDHVPDCHLVKLGTMGEYGRPTSTSRRATSRSSTTGARTPCPIPKLPASLYHCSKVHDSTNIHFACRIWGLRATDLNQGVVYGIETEESGRDDRLVTRFDYDEIFGTVLNRFCAAGGDRPPADRLRRRHPDPRLPQHPRHPRLRRTGGARTPPTPASSASSTSSPSSSRCSSWPNWSRHAGESSATRSRSSTARTPGSRRKSTTTTRSTPSCSTSASSRPCSARSWSSR